MGEIPLHVNVQGKKPAIKVTLKGVLWIPGQPCQLLSTRTIRRDKVEFADSRTEGYLRFRKNGPKITLAESCRHPCNHEASADASFANKKQSLTMKERYNILGHVEHSAIEHL